MRGHKRRLADHVHMVLKRPSNNECLGVDSRCGSSDKVIGEPRYSIFLCRQSFVAVQSVIVHICFVILYQSFFLSAANKEMKTQFHNTYKCMENKGF